MKTMHIIARIPLGYDDFGCDALTEKGQGKYDELIAKRLPDEAFWCGDEILATVDANIGVDIDEIINEAAEEMLSCFSDAEYWEEA